MSTVVRSLAAVEASLTCGLREWTERESRLTARSFDNPVRLDWTPPPLSTLLPPPSNLSSLSSLASAATETSKNALSEVREHSAKWESRSGETQRHLSDLAERDSMREDALDEQCRAKHAEREEQMRREFALRAAEIMN